MNQHLGRAAPMPVQVRAKAVQGVLPGGTYAQIWLSLEPEFADAEITVLAEWDRLYPAANGLNFFIFDEQQLRRLSDGRNSYSALALAAGNPGFALSTPDHVTGAGFRATGWAVYSLVVINESAQEAHFTLRATNAFLTDVSNGVIALDAALSPTATPPLPTLAPTTPITPTVTTVTTATVAPALITTATVTATMTPVATVLPSARTSLGLTKRQRRISGELTTPDAQQLLRIKPTKVNGQILLRLATDGGTSVLNFWVFDDAGLAEYLMDGNSTVRAMSSGKPVFRSASNERVAGFRATDTAPYTVVIYSNNAILPIRYTLVIEGAQLLESTYLP